MSAQHTPGPWECEPDGRFGSVTADTPCGNGWIICDLGVRTDLVCNSAEDLGSNIISQIKANTRLIAAAPELLVALSALLPNNLCLTNDAWSDETIIPLDVTLGDLRKAAAALAKAAGAA